MLLRCFRRHRRFSFRYLWQVLLLVLQYCTRSQFLICIILSLFFSLESFSYHICIYIAALHLATAWGVCPKRSLLVFAISLLSEYAFKVLSSQPYII